MSPAVAQQQTYSARMRRGESRRARRTSGMGAIARSYAASHSTYIEARRFPFRLARQSFMLKYEHSGGAVTSAGFAQYLLAALAALPTDPGATAPLGGFTSLPVFTLMYLP